MVLLCASLSGGACPAPCLACPCPLGCTPTPALPQRTSRCRLELGAMAPSPVSPGPALRLRLSFPRPLLGRVRLSKVKDPPPWNRPAHPLVQARMLAWNGSLHCLRPRPTPDGPRVCYVATPLARCVRYGWLTRWREDGFPDGRAQKKMPACERPITSRRLTSHKMIVYISMCLSPSKGVVAPQLLVSARLCTVCCAHGAFADANMAKEIRISNMFHKQFQKKTKKM